MANPARLARLRALPPEVFDEFFSPDDYEQTHAVAERYGLKKEQEEALSNTLSDVFLKDVPVEKLPETFADRLKVPPEVAKKIAIDIAGTRLLKLPDYFGDVPRLMLSWGGDPANFLSVRAFDDRAALVLSEEISKKLSLNLAGDVVQKLAAMVGSRVRGVRDDSEFKEALGKPAEKGGVAMNAETAQKILDEVLGFLKTEKKKPPERKEAAEEGAAPVPEPPVGVTEIPALRDWVIAASGLKMDVVLGKRFGELVESRLDGSRDAAAFKEVLTRGTKVGGLGTPALSADKVIQLAETAAARSKSQVANRKSDDTPLAISHKPGVAAPTAPLLGATHEAMTGGTPQPPPRERSPQSGIPTETSGQISPPKPSVPPQPKIVPVPAAPTSQSVAPSPPPPKVAPSPMAPPTAPKVVASAKSFSEDELEIATAAQALPQKVPMDAVAISAKLQDTITAVLRLSGLTFPNLDIQKRFENTVSARLRDLRDAAETTEMATKAVTEGGVGLSSEQVKAIIPILEEHVRALHAELQMEKKREIEEWKKQEATKSEGRRSARGLAEEASRDALMARITAKSKKAQKAAATSPTPPVLGKSPIANRKSDDVPSAISHTPSSVMRPKMQDVRFTPKLVGPVEELRGITLNDFRRLSKDPKEGAVKIRDKVDLLGQESYTQRIVAVTAWQESEVYRLYLEVLRESLGGGKPTKEVIAGRGAAGKPTLTESEFAAIMELSRTLRL